MTHSLTVIREACLEQARIDTHAHITESYPTLEEQAEQMQTFATTEALSGARVAAEGCRRLYGTDIGAFLRPDSAASAFQQASDLRRRGAWGAIEHALDRARIDQQLAFCAFRARETRPFAETPDRRRLAYLAFVDEALNSAFEYPCPDFPPTDQTVYMRLCDLLGPLAALDDYLGAIDAEIDGWRSLGVVGMKTAAAYTSGLAMSSPTEAAGRAAFARKNDMNRVDFTVVRDYAFHHALRACLRNGLPVVIHTGFQIWGHSSLAQANPMLLHNLLIDNRYRDLTFVLLHGGNPYVGETTYLAGMFPNVILDFTWIGWLTPARFRLALAEWLATVPHDRMCWGSDSGTPESIAGTDSTMRRLIADTLEAAVADRTVDERYALEFIDNVYRRTPQRVFGLPA
jgi:hypothetical protein